MSHYLNDLIPNCEALQRNLNEVFMTCDPNSAVSDKFPLAEFLTSPANRNGLSQTVHDAPGKLKTVKVIYPQRYLESHVEENSEAFCTTGEARGRLSHTYELDPHANLLAKATFEKRDFTYNCERAGSYLATELLALIDVWERAAAKKISEQAIALTGDWGADQSGTINGSEELVIKTQKDASIDPYPYTMEDIDEALMKAGYCGPVFIAGGSTLWKYFRRVLAGCCTDSGLDIGELLSLYGRAVSYDRRVKDAYASQHKSLAVQQGALQVLHFAEAGWDNGKPIEDWGSNYALRGIVTPRLSIPVDLYLKDDCPGTLTMSLSGVVKTVGLPTDMFATGDTFEGVTFANTILVTNV